MNPTQVNPNDPDVIALSKAIFQRESGGNFNAVGDAGTSHGAGQWQAATWKTQAHDVLGDPNAPMTPENQKAVISVTVAKRKAAGLTPAQIAAEWNSGHPDGWEHKVGVATINGQQVPYDVPKYVKDVTDLYHQYKGQNVQDDSQDGSGVQTTNLIQGQDTPAPATNLIQSQNDTSNLDAQIAALTSQSKTQDEHPGFLQGLGEDLTGSNPESLGTQLGNTAKGVGNFLFPVVGDLYHDIKGDSTKTALQQTGDAALSAIGFVPGLGEVGEGTRAAGLVGKLGASTVAKGAALGYGAGVASNLSQGEGLGQSLLPNVNTVAGTVLGGAAPAALKAGGALLKGVAGINPQIETELARMGSQGAPEDAQLYDKYLANTKAHATDLTKPAPLNMAADELDKAASKIQSLLSESGKKVGEVNRAASSITISPTKLAPVAEDFNNRLESFGQKVMVNQDGKHVLVPTRRGGVELTPAEQKRILDVAAKIDELGQQGTVRMADDLMTTLDKKVDYGFGGQDPLQGLFKQVRGQVNAVARESAPGFAAANDASATLHKLQDELHAMAGNNTQRGELLMRRVFSGDKSGDVQDLFGKIKAATGIDLVKHAVLAKHAIDTVGSSADKTLLQQAIEGGVAAHTGGLISGALKIGQGVARKALANPEKIGRNLVRGKRPAGLIGNTLTKGAIEASRLVKPVTGL